MFLVKSELSGGEIKKREKGKQVWFSTVLGRRGPHKMEELDTSHAVSQISPQSP